MISALLRRNKNGALVSATAEGHAGYAEKGADIVCAAVSVLVRTTAYALRSDSAVSVSLKAEKPGAFLLTVMDFMPQSEQKLVYAADFLTAGLQSLEAEFPECVSVTIRTEK